MFKGAIIGAIVGGLAVVLLAIFQPKRHCPDCGQQFPKFRKPGSGREALRGGWTCSQCGCAVDRKARKI